MYGIMREVWTTKHTFTTQFWNAPTREWVSATNTTYPTKAEALRVIKEEGLTDCFTVRRMK